MTVSKQIKRLFIANRGEISRRIAMSAKQMGIETVAICEGSIAPNYLLSCIDEFVFVKEENTQLYLDAKQMIAFAKASNCDAIHPGFGFLSENAEFAEAVTKAGLIWVGPNRQAIDAMASKAKARAVAQESQVPCVPGLNGLDLNSKTGFAALQEFTNKNGYPILLKAAYGGGGKGMRIVRRPEELQEAATRAQSEAKSAFGNDLLICERYLETPRHVEVQVFADKHGQVYILGDRDCSMQRRHQKILEEAPAPLLSPKTRQKMHEAAHRLAASVGYDNAGTVEFLVDWDEKNKKADEQTFFFLEMNTRLQVEHPVTEEVFGVDLVAWQLKVAQGEKLPKEWAHLSPQGHSIEVRIYAENCLNDFFPSPGRVAAFVPYQGPGIRWEVGLDAMDEITGKFDPMIAKLVVKAENRDEAFNKLRHALDETFLAGPINNLGFLALLCDLPEVRAVSGTDFIPHNYSRLKELLQQRELDSHAAASNTLKLLGEQAASSHQMNDHLNIDQLTQNIFGYGKLDSRTVEAGETATEKTLFITAEHVLTNPRLQATQTGRTAAQSLVRCGWVSSGLSSSMRESSNKTSFWYACHRASSNSGSGKQEWIRTQGHTHLFEAKGLEDELQLQTQNNASGGDIKAPVPGKVIAVHIQPGVLVAAGQPLLVLESMKMEFEVRASADAKVVSVAATVGDQVSAGQSLVICEVAEETA